MTKDRTVPALSNPRRLAFAAWVLGFWSALASGIEPSLADEVQLLRDLPDDFVTATMAVAREEGLPKATLSDGSLVGEETEEERKQPLISAADGESIMQVALASAVADWCGLEWKVASFGKLMHEERARNDLSDKAISYVAVLHGVTMGIFGGQFRAMGPCRDEQRRTVQEYLRQRWP
jgi:hypothetical protein